MTYNQLIDTFRTIATNHGQIQSFQHGQLSEVDINKLDATSYPFLFVVVSSVTLQYGQRDYQVDIIVAERVQSDMDDRTDVWSDTLLIMEDVINEFRHASSSTSNAAHGFLPEGIAVTCDPFTERFDNILTGWETRLSVVEGSNNNLCLRP